MGTAATTIGDRSGPTGARSMEGPLENSRIILILTVSMGLAAWLAVALVRRGRRPHPTGRPPAGAAQPIVDYGASDPSDPFSWMRLRLRPLERPGAIGRRHQPTEASAACQSTSRSLCCKTTVEVVLAVVILRRRWMPTTAWVWMFAVLWFILSPILALGTMSAVSALEKPIPQPSSREWASARWSRSSASGFIMLPLASITLPGTDGERTTAGPGAKARLLRCSTAFARGPGKRRNQVALSAVIVIAGLLPVWPLASAWATGGAGRLRPELARPGRSRVLRSWIWRSDEDCGRRETSLPDGSIVQVSQGDSGAWTEVTVQGGSFSTVVATPSTHGQTVGVVVEFVVALRVKVDAGVYDIGPSRQPRDVVA